MPEEQARVDHILTHSDKPGVRPGDYVTKVADQSAVGLLLEEGQRQHRHGIQAGRGEHLVAEG
jgi:hypothetical protein